MKKAFLLVASLNLAIPVHAEDQEYNAIRGYHWYQTPAVEEENQSSGKKEDRQPLPPPPSKAEMLKMHPDDLKDLLSNYEKEAIWKLTPETVANYYKVRDVVRRKALAFAAVSSYTALTNPAMASNFDSQGGLPGQPIQTQQRQSEIDRTIVSSRSNYALAMFYAPTCPYCPKQHAILEIIKNQYGFPLTEIDITKRMDLAEKYNVERTPVTILIKKDSEKWLPIAMGLTGVYDLRASMFRSIRLLDGKISPEQFFMFDYQSGGTMDPYAVKE